MIILEDNNPKPRSKSLGLFLGLAPVYYICTPVAWGQAVAQADDIFGDDPNTLV